MDESQSDLYTLDDLIETLEEIKENGEGNLNFPKAYYCLAKEIEKIKEYLDYFHDIVPQKYKKRNPQQDESPFFTKNDFNKPVDPKEYEEAKKRMAAFLEKAKQQTSGDFSVSSES